MISNGGEHDVNCFVDACTEVRTTNIASVALPAMDATIRLRIRLLGPALIERDDDDVTAGISGRGIALIAFLATANGHRVRREAVMDLLWPDGPEPRIQSNLRTLLTRLRKKLPGLLTTDRETIAFHAAANSWIDVVEFEAWTRGSERLPPEHAVRQRERALRLVRGEFAEGLAPEDAPRFDDWVYGQRKSIAAKARIQRMKLAQAWRSLGRPERACAVAGGMLEADPLDEPGVMEFMSAHAALGDTGRALREFHAFRARLEEALDLEPSRAARDLAAQIEHNTLRPVPTPARRAPPTLGLAAETTSFHGRDAEVQRLRELLHDRTRRLVTVLGYGGLGKSRLAREVARTVSDEYAHGVLFVPLPIDGGGDDPEGSIRTAISRAAGLPPADRDTLAKWLTERDLLLVLDGAGAWAAARDAFVALIHAAPLVTVLVTSREQLGIQAETVVRLGSLPAPTAAALFRERARAWTGEEISDHDGEAVNTICELVAGSPLGIEIAASNAGAMPLHAIAEQVRENPERVASDRMDVEPRHRSFAGIFRASWQRLDAEEQAALARLALFAGPFDNITAWEGAGVSPEFLARFHAKSLLQVQAGLYSLHPVVHRLVIARDGPARAAQHVRGLLSGFAERPRPCTLPGWYLQNIEAAAARAPSVGETHVLGQTADRLVCALGARTIPILRAGIAAATDPSTRLCIATSLARSLQEHLRYDEGLDVLVAALGQDDVDDDNGITWEARARVAALHAARGERELARQLAESAETGARQASAPGAAVAARLVRVQLEDPRRECDAAIELAEEGTRQARALDRYREHVGLLRETARLTRQRDTEAALDALGEAEGLAETAGDRLTAVSIAADFGGVEWLRGNHKAAARTFEDVLTRAEAIPAPSVALRMRFNLANAMCVTGSLETAEGHARMALRVAGRANLAPVAARARALLANIHLRLGELDCAWSEACACLAASDETNPPDEPLMDAMQAARLLARDDVGDYATRLEAALERGMTPHRAAWAWTVLGRYWRDQGETVRAISAFERATEGPGSGRSAATLELAWHDAQEGRKKKARDRLASLPDEARTGWQFYRVLSALDDPAAPDVLQRLVEDLHQQADKISSPARRATFLRHAPDNNEVMAEWAGLAENR